MSELREALDVAQQPGDIREALEATGVFSGPVRVTSDGLVAVIDQAAESESDPERRRKLHDVASTLRELGWHFSVEVTAAVLARLGGF